MTTGTTHQPIAVTVAQMAKAFEAWENGVRTDPSNYLTPEECAALSVSEAAASRASYFHKLLTEAG